MNRDALVEGLKELIRMALITFLPIAIDSLVSGEINLRFLAISGGVALLKALDKTLHENDVKSPLDLKSLDSLK